MSIYKFIFKTVTGTRIELCGSGNSKDEALQKVLSISPVFHESWADKKPVTSKELISYRNSTKRPANFVA